MPQGKITKFAADSGFIEIDDETFVYRPDGTVESNTAFLAIGQVVVFKFTEGLTERYITSIRRCVFTTSDSTSSATVHGDLLKVLEDARDRLTILDAAGRPLGYFVPFIIPDEVEEIRRKLAWTNGGSTTPQVMAHLRKLAEREYKSGTWQKPD